VDADTGYRYYHAGQARQALSIALLRSLDVPLPVVGQVLSGSPDALTSVRDSLEADLERRRRTLASLERVMAGGLPAPQVRLVTEPALRVALVRERAAGPADIARATGEAIARLMACARHTGQVRLIGLFPVDLSDDGFDISAALVLDGTWEAGAGTGVRAGVLPGGTFAGATHVGPYDQIGLTAHAVLAWCAERRHPLRGPIREVYLNDPATTPPDQLLTHLMIPLEEDQ
jgi:effector-binding domain-containing protein